MISMRIGTGCAPTGQLLTTLLNQRNVQTGANGQAVVCYGVGYSGTLPALNKNVGRYDKFEQFRVMREKGVRVPDFFSPTEAARQTFTAPLFGRKLMHREGKDIMPALQPEDVPLRVAAGARYFTRYIPRLTEVRCWIFRRQHLSSYEKRMRHPEMYKHFGCSYRNGFAFELLKADEVNRGAAEQAALAVDALDLDFGAVDVLIGKDNLPYVLEVNTAPGVDGARVSITALADKIARWTTNGYLRRNGETR